MNIPHNEKVSSHNKAMERGLKPATAKPGRTKNTYMVIIVSFFSDSNFILHIEIRTQEYFWSNHSGKSRLIEKWTALQKDRQQSCHPKKGKRVLQLFFKCMQHPKAGQNTQQAHVFDKGK